MKLPVFLLLLFVVACTNPKASKKESPSACTDRVFELDKTAGDIRNHACEQIPLSETINNYTKTLSGIDFSTCSDRFASTFQEHIQAWNALLPITDKYPDLRGEMHELFDEIEVGADSTQFKALVASVWSSWGAVEEAAKEKEEDSNLNTNTNTNTESE